MVICRASGLFVLDEAAAPREGGVLEMVGVGNLLRMKRMIDLPCQSSLFCAFDRKHSSAAFCTLASFLFAIDMGMHVLTRDTFGFFGQRGWKSLLPFLIKGYHDVRAQKPHDPGFEIGRVE